MQRILWLKRAKNISKQITGAVSNLAISNKDSNNWEIKRKANNDEESFSCHTFGHYM